MTVCTARLSTVAYLASPPNLNRWSPMLSLFCFAALLLAASLPTAAHAEEDMTCRIGQSAVQKFATAVFPMEFEGTKTVGVNILGAEVTQDVPWRAIVSNPVITIGQQDRTFSADVVVESGGLTWNGRVDGKLNIEYVQKKRVVLIKVVDAIVPVTLGPLTMQIDVAKEIPDLPFSVALPDMVIPFRGHKIAVLTRPRLTFVEGAIVVGTETAFRVQ